MHFTFVHWLTMSAVLLLVACADANPCVPTPHGIGGASEVQAAVDPCAASDELHIVKVYSGSYSETPSGPRRPVSLPLRCGNESYGYRHLLARLEDTNHRDPITDAFFDYQIKQTIASAPNAFFKSRDRQGREQTRIRWSKKFNQQEDKCAAAPGASW